MYLGFTTVVVFKRLFYTLVVAFDVAVGGVVQYCCFCLFEELNCMITTWIDWGFTRRTSTAITWDSTNKMHDKTALRIEKIQNNKNHSNTQQLRQGNLYWKKNLYIIEKALRTLRYDYNGPTMNEYYSESLKYVRKTFVYYYANLFLSKRVT